MTTDRASGDWPLAYTVTTPECRHLSPMGYAAALDEAAPVLAELGYDGVEAQVRNPAGLGPEALRATLEPAGLALAAVATGPVASEDGLTLADVAEPARRDRAIGRVIDAIDLAAHFGALVTIGRIRGDPGPGEPERRLAAREALDQIDAAALAAGVKVVLEPQSRVVGPFLPTVADAVALIEQAAWQAIGVMPDTFHMSLEERSCVAGLLAAGPLLWHLQLGDTNRLPLGAGGLDTGLVADVLDALGYRGWLTMEHAQGRGSRDAARQSAQVVATMRDRVRS